jgi:sigma-54-specific transcriptional regulator
MMTQQRNVDSHTDADLSYAVHTDACVLFTGEHEATDALARRLHALSGRRGPFVAVDCGAPDANVRLLELLDEENPDKPQSSFRPRVVQSGTVFLREVGLLDQTLQTRLLERLPELRMSPDAERRMGRRVISSSSTPLAARVESGAFDARLFYRLNVIHVVIDQCAVRPERPMPASRSVASGPPPTSTQ